MTEHQLAERQTRADRETFITAETEQGFRVHSPTEPGKAYEVVGVPEAPTCTCPDFQFHGEDATWKCKHILAVLKRFDFPPSEEPGTNGSPVPKNGPKPKLGPAYMTLKRSISPDGRIDSLSVEFSYPITDGNVTIVAAQAGEAIRLQGAIVGQFLQSQRPSSPKGNGHATPANGAVAGRLLHVGGMNGRWGRRLFIDVQVNGRTARLFGKREELVAAVATAGYVDQAQSIEEGIRLDLPCRVVTQATADGKYLNVTKVMPGGPSPASNGRPRA